MLSDFVLDTRWSDIPPEARDATRLWLLDLVGVAASGSRTALSRIARDHAADHCGAGRRGARMLFDGRTVSPQGAALSGGMTIDAMDAHDGHKLAKGHVGCGVMPALAALSDAHGLDDDREFLTALVIGYEIGTRASMALHRMACDYHSSGAWIAVACAALGARMLGLDPRRLQEAMGIAEYHGPRSQMMRCIDHPTMVKDGSGWGAMAGVAAAYLAADGFTGAPALTVTAADVADLWSDLGTHWRVLEQYVKFYPVCRWAQPAVDAVLALRAAHGLRSQDVETVEIATFHEARRLATTRPRTTEEAQYSTAYPAAVALVRGRVEPEDVHEDALIDPEVQRLARAMSVFEDPEYDAAFPARRFARVSLRLRDGRTVASPATEAGGDPETGIAAARVHAKFHRYATPLLGAVHAKRCASDLLALGDGGGLGPFFGHLCRAGVPMPV